MVSVKQAEIIKATPKNILVAGSIQRTGNSSLELFFVRASNQVYKLKVSRYSEVAHYLKQASSMVKGVKTIHCIIFVISLSN